MGKKNFQDKIRDLGILGPRKVEGENKGSSRMICADEMPVGKVAPCQESGGFADLHVTNRERWLKREKGRERL